MFTEGEVGKMMRDCIRLLYERRSVRRFKEDDVDDTTIIELLESANSAPSAGNLQPRDFIIVRDPEIKADLSRAALNQRFISRAPVVIVVVANFPRSMNTYGERGYLYAIQDCSAAIQNLLLAATAMGLGTCWVGAFDEEMVSQILDLPDYTRPMAIIPVGYPADRGHRTGRKKIEELIHRERW